MSARQQQATWIIITMNIIIVVVIVIIILNQNGLENKLHSQSYTTTSCWKTKYFNKYLTKMQRKARNQLRIIMSCITFALFNKHNLPQKGIKACSINIYAVPSHKEELC